MTFFRCSGGELFDQIAELDGDHYGETDCCKLMYQIAHGVKYMHSMGIVHRDLKPENILCVDPNSIKKIKIADFGISKMVKNPENIDNVTFRTMAGTLSYTAPEILRGKGYNKAVDYWSIGVIMYILLCGYAPFYGETDTELSYEILKSPVPFEKEDWEHVSPNTQELVKGLLEKDPTKRKCLDDILKLVWQNTSANMPTKMRCKLKNTIVERKKHRMSTPLGAGISRNSKYSSKNRYRSKNSSNNNSNINSHNSGKNSNQKQKNNAPNDAVMQLTLPWHERDSMIIKEEK